MDRFDSRRFRDVLSSYATGVTVVTALAADGRAVAATVNSFASVSLVPPLVLWSVQRDVGPFADFAAAGHFAVHVLHAGQADLANHFARDIDDKFREIGTNSGIAGLPLLPEYAALLQCATEHRYPGGDHLILVGRVLALEQRATEPLVFHAGRFRALSPD
jgi:flavin reductase (DIM6/NTAB) family NADH-FMN oxidoreductase RutF